MPDSTDGHRLDRTTVDPSPSGSRSSGRGAVELEPGLITPGLRIERYEIIRELGRGGMGHVFLARDCRLGRRVAMKFLTSISPEYTQQFLVEARATARCSHENIVVIHEVNQYRSMPYMVLEYLEGTTLRKLMTGKRLPAGRAVELMVPIIRALARAHEADIIHRDLKPDNIVVTATGAVKVLDFGIAQHGAVATGSSRPSSASAIVGTLPYMSPEQLGTEDVDHRSDLWAAGIILYELLAGKHPLEPLSRGVLFAAAAAVDEPMPSFADDASGLPDQLVHIVARCLAKTKAARYASADELLVDLEPLLPARAGRRLVADESPYPGLNAFQESDADRFFGRSHDVAGTVVRLRDQPLVAVVGPSGVGKSSFIRAGVVPALKASGEPWEVLIVRPGRQPLSTLASVLESLRDARDSEPLMDVNVPGRLRLEPGTFGARLRSRALRRRTQILLFVDQHEELYTLVPDADERRAFVACLTAAADDPSGPLRVVVAMRSDLLDRAAEDRRFSDELSRGLVFLQPPSRAGLEEALTTPLESVGYSFEPGIVPEMLATLEATPGSLPLLQFTAAKLWETREKQRRVLTRASYAAMGGVAGALATHADDVLAGLGRADQKLVRAMFQRLVTPERTRAVVDTSELHEISPDIDRLISYLVGARLVGVQNRAGQEGGAIELVHESLITSWPTLRRWLEEDHEDAAFVAQLRAAAKQWDQKGRPAGLVWREEAMREAQLWRARHNDVLPVRDQAFLDAVFSLAARDARRKRRFWGIVIAALLVALAVAVVALVVVSKAKHTAITAEQTARDKEQEARTEAKRAREAEATIKEQLEVIEQKESAREEAEAVANSEKREKEQAKEAVREKDADLAKKNAALESALASAREAAAELQKQLSAAQKREAALQKAKVRRTITNDLK